MESYGDPSVRKTSENSSSIDGTLRSRGNGSRSTRTRGDTSVLCLRSDRFWPRVDLIIDRNSRGSSDEAAINRALISSAASESLDMDDKDDLRLREAGWLLDACCRLGDT